MVFLYFKMRFWNTISSLNNSNGKNPKWHSSMFLHKSTIVQHIVTSKALSCALEQNGKLHHTVKNRSLSQVFLFKSMSTVMAHTFSS